MAVFVVLVAVVVIVINYSKLGFSVQDREMAGLTSSCHTYR